MCSKISSTLKPAGYAMLVVALAVTVMATDRPIGMGEVMRDTDSQEDGSTRHRNDVDESDQAHGREAEEGEAQKVRAR